MNNPHFVCSFFVMAIPRRNKNWRGVYLRRYSFCIYIRQIFFLHFLNNPQTNIITYPVASSKIINKTFFSVYGNKILTFFGFITIFFYYNSGWHVATRNLITSFVIIITILIDVFLMKIFFSLLRPFVKY